MQQSPGPQTQAKLKAAQGDRRLVQAALALQHNDLSSAERLLKARLRENDEDIAALRMLAELAARLGRLEDAQELLERTLKLAPDFQAARLNYATVLHRRNRLPEALAELDQLLESAPDDPAAQALKAAALARIGDYDAAVALYQDILGRFPQQARLWMSLGHALKTIGRQADSIAAYRRTLELQPSLGEVWWSLANLKTVRFDDADIAAMSSALADQPTPADRYHLHYALGKALEDTAQYEASFRHYAEGARLRRLELPYDPQESSLHLARTLRFMTADALAARAGQGCPDPAPIFIVGLPRAGSTLIEQILASHSQVEGTMELPDLGVIARDLAGPEADGPKPGGDAEAAGYFEALLALDAEGLAKLGQCYLSRIRIQRKTDKPYVIDKMPNNFAHVGLIHLILPNAKIIDARRHPMANCFSAFKQHFSRGQGFSYDLNELGRYYHEYSTLMQHYDDVIPNRIHKIVHENLINHPEAEIRKLLDYCSLGFEENCLNFYRTERPVRTASSEQVRRPLDRAGVDQWRHFSPWLGPLERALGDTVAHHASMLVTP